MAVDMDTGLGNNFAGSGPMEQFLILAKSAKGAAAVELIKQVLETPGIYVFGELLDCASIKELADNETFSAYYQLLNIFAFGTYSDYLSNAERLPQLTIAMINKLRHLTIVSLAMKSKYIPYSVLLKELDMRNLRELEDLIIEVIYANVVSGKMDQSNNCLEVDHTIGRDIKPEHLKKVISVLSDWCRNCDSVLKNIEMQIATANQLKDEHLRNKQQIEAQVTNIKKTIKNQDMDDPMSTDGISCSPRETRDGSVEKVAKRNASKSKGLRGSGSKFWRKDN